MATKTAIFTVTDAPPGTRTLAQRTVPTGVVAFTLSLSRDSWPNVGGEVVQASFEISQDNGSTWLFLAGFGAPGGTLLKRDGTVLLESSVTIDLPQPDNTQRRIRATVTNAAVISTTVSITVDV